MCYFLMLNCGNYIYFFLQYFLQVYHVLAFVIVASDYASELSVFMFFFSVLYIWSLHVYKMLPLFTLLYAAQNI